MAVGNGVLATIRTASLVGVGVAVGKLAAVGVGVAVGALVGVKVGNGNGVGFVTTEVAVTVITSGVAVGRAVGSLPQMAPATARNIKPRPIVSINTEKCGSPIMGRTTRRSVSAPSAAMVNTVAMTAITKGRSRIPA